VLGMVNNGEWVRNLVFLIGIIVANVPEGLLATVTVSLTLTATRMAYKNVQVKNLESVETLGSTSVICSDKTGTLTTSIMTVKHVLFDITPVEAPTSGSPTLEIQGKGTLYDYVGDYPNIKPSFHRLLRIGLLCNNAKMVYNEASGEKKIVGDATESAVFKYCNAHVTRQWQAQDSENRQKYAERNPEQAKRLSATALYRESFPQLHQIPFNSANKWQISIHKQEAGKYSVGDDMPEFELRPIIVLKGAPEKVLDMCETYLDGGVEKPLTAEVQAAIVAENEKLAREGERVLGFADMELDPAEYDISLPEPEVIMCNDDTEAIDVPGVYVKWGGDNIAVPLQNTYTHGDRAGQVKQVLDHTFKELYEEFAKLVDKQAGSIRISFLDPKEWCDYDVKLKDAKVRFEDGKASVLHAQEGPYRFIGNSRKDCNWPFGRTDMNGERVERGLCFVGFYAMIDPPRATVPGAVLKCKEAGIKVIMVTGDHPTTANAIAKQVNIVGVYDDDFDWSPYRHKPQKYHMTKQDIAEVEGIALEQVAIDDPRYMCALVPGQKSKHTIKGWTLQEKELEGDKHPEKFIEFWNEVLTKESVVFARTSPEQKLRIVEACQLRGGIVAVTGDGVNDSPALKKADIGVAMGITGTDVAKETADMILKDDNFASIVNGVEEGRIIFDNLKKSIAYTLSSNIPEISPFIMYQLLMIPLPLSTVMILLVDLGTDLAPAISLAHEDSELDIMERSPRDQHTDKLVTMRLISFSYLQIGCIQALAGFYAYMVVLWSYGLRPEFLVGLDSNSLYEWKPYDFRDGKNQYEGFWLYCFEDTDDDCLYAPDPSVFDCWWDDDRVWNDDLSQKYGYAKHTRASANDHKCTNSKNTKKNSVPFGEWYGETDDWIEDWVKKVETIYQDHVESQSTTQEPKTNNLPWPDNSGACQSQNYPIVQSTETGAEVRFAGLTPMQQAFRRCYEYTEPDNDNPTDQQIEADWGCSLVILYQNDEWGSGGGPTEPITVYRGKCDETDGTKLPSSAKNFRYTSDKGNYRRPKAKYLDDFVTWQAGYKVSDACKEGGCLDNTKMFRAYTVAVYELVPFRTYVTDVYPERDCWDQNLDSFKVEVGAKYYGTDYEEGSGESRCQAFDDSEGKGVMSWNYWLYSNADCTVLAACLTASEDLTGHTASSETMVYGTLFPIQMTDRYYALRQSNSAYFISIIVVQWADLMICKTRVRSLFEQGMTNVFMNYSIFFETALGALLVYLPVANTVTATAPLKFVWWTPAVPFSILIYTYDELRKGYIRAAREAGTGSWVEKNTYW